MTVLSALAQVAEYKEHREGLNCPACGAHPAELCDVREAGLKAAAGYRRLAVSFRIVGRGRFVPWTGRTTDRMP
jgi:hypothetical protein